MRIQFTNKKLPWITIPIITFLGFFAGGLSLALADGDPLVEATYVILGTVVSAQSTTLKVLAASAETYTVQVDEVYFQKGSFGDQTGNRITIVDTSQKLQAGVQYVFYTQPFMFGESIAAEALQVKANQRLNSQAARAMQSTFELQEVRRRVEKATMVIAGTVKSIRQVKQTQPFESEHVPDLREAIVKVDRILKGDVSETEVAFLFAASKDVHYFRAPKFKEGDGGIFILSAGTEIAASMKLGVQKLTLFDSRDFQPTEKLEAIRAMAQKSAPTQTIK